MKKIKILYEDENVLVIDKPAGMAVHDDFKHGQKNTVADWVLENYPEMKNVGESQDGIPRPGIVHRLDKDTSGVLVLTKNQRSYKFLKKQFQERAVKKVYRAIVYGRLKNDSGIIDRPIGRSRADFTAKQVGSAARGELRSAVTYYKVLERFGGYSLLELRPKTGRTHQLRVHLKSISHPIACDPVYAKGRLCPSGLKRQALHALSVEFKLPSGKMLATESPLPADFKKALAHTPT